MKQNHAFEQMRKAAIQRLDSRAPEDLAERSGAVFHGESAVLEISSLGKHYTLSLPTYECHPDMESWHYLILLHYLDLADGTPVSPCFCTFGDLKDGLVRGTKFDHTVTQALCQFLRGRNQEQLTAICKQLGGQITNSHADFSAVLPLFPRLPFLLKVWYADEEFPASGTLLPACSTSHYLAMEDAVVAGELLLTKLQQVSPHFETKSSGSRESPDLVANIR